MWRIVSVEDGKCGEQYVWRTVCVEDGMCGGK